MHQQGKQGRRRLLDMDVNNTGFKILDTYFWSLRILVNNGCRDLYMFEHQSMKEGQCPYSEVPVVLIVSKSSSSHTCLSLDQGGRLVSDHFSHFLKAAIRHSHPLHAMIGQLWGWERSQKLFWSRNTLTACAFIYIFKQYQVFLFSISALLSVLKSSHLWYL